MVCISVALRHKRHKVGVRGTYGANSAYGATMSPVKNVKMGNYLEIARRALNRLASATPIGPDSKPRDLEFIEVVRPDGGRSWIHPDYANEDFQVIDPPDPCPECGKLELWQTMAGNWRCLRCDPPTTARRLRQAATRLKSKPQNRRE